MFGESGSGIRLLDEDNRRSLARRLAASATHIQINVADPSVGVPFAPPDGRLPDLQAYVGLWVDAATGAAGRVDDALTEAGGDWYGYLVCEAEPLRNTKLRPDPTTGRLPGFAQLVLLVRPERLSWGEWQRAWQEEHTAVALSTQSTFRYVQNVVVRPLSTDAPDVDAVVEECFPAEAAFDLHAFFDTAGDESRLERNMKAMVTSCDRFMDGLPGIAWTAEYVVAG